MLNKANSTYEDGPEVEPSPHKNESQATPVDPTSLELDRYQGPRSKRELDEQRERRRQEFEQSIAQLDPTSSSKPILEGKLQEELGQLTREFERYQELYRQEIDRDIRNKERELRTWASENDIPDKAFFTYRKTESEKPWETAEIGILVDVAYYSKVQEWLKKSHVQIDYSWGGRMAAYDLDDKGKFKQRSAFRDFAFFETSDTGKRVVRPRNDEFKQFALERDVRLPTATEIQRKMDSIDRSEYERAIREIERRADSDVNDARRLYELKEKLEAALTFMRIGVKEPLAEYDLSDRASIEHPDRTKETTYNDLTYNADDFLSDVEWEEAGISPNNRLTFGIDGKRIEALCKEFGEELSRRGIYH